jgi:D-sedoheptulose 7-phosphate isomerase
MRWFGQYIQDHKSALDELSSSDIEAIVQLIAEAQFRGSSIWVIGNGGSLANAAHFAEDLGKGASDALEKLRDVEKDVFKVHEAHPGGDRFRVQALNDPSWITALGNDKSFDDVFVEQLKTMSKPSDILIGISVSGTSPNLTKAFKWANDNELITIALTGMQARGNPHSIYASANLSVAIPSTHYGHVEDLQMFILHAICYYFIENLKEQKPEHPYYNQHIYKPEE